MSDTMPAADPTAKLPALPRSIIRTIVPSIVGQLVAWAAVAHISVDPSTQAAASAELGVVLTGGYYAAVRALEARYPAVGWLLGAKGAPTYPTTSTTA